jgi:tetratricopeptide (TPR) repeat protein
LKRVPSDDYEVPVLGIPILAAIIGLVFFVALGGYYVYVSMAGPRRIEEIDRLIRQNRVREAVFQLEKLLDKDDRNMRGHYMMARCHQKLNAPARAILSLRQCTKIARYSPEVTEAAVRKLLAACFESSGNHTEAKNEYLLLTQLEPEVYEHFYHVGELFFRAGVQPKAMQFLKKAVALNAKHADSLSLLGQCEYQQGNYQDAKNALGQAVQIKPDHSVARYFLGLSLRYLGDAEWAVKEFEKAEKDEGLREKALLAKGMALIDMEAYPRAIIELERGLKLSKAGSEIMINMNYLLALAAERSRDLATAIRHWEIVDKLRPNYRDVREKLKQYQEFRTDDSIKDFLIANAEQFEETSRKMLEGLGYSISSLKRNSDLTIEALVSDSDGTANQRNIRKFYTLIFIQRDMSPVSERQVRDFHEQMREKNASRGIVMTTGDIMPQAANFASTRPIDIFDAAKTADALKGIAG